MLKEKNVKVELPDIVEEFMKNVNMNSDTFLSAIETITFIEDLDLDILDDSKPILTSLEEVILLEEYLTTNEQKDMMYNTLIKTMLELLGEFNIEVDRNTPLNIMNVLVDTVLKNTVSINDNPYVLDVFNILTLSEETDELELFINILKIMNDINESEYREYLLDVSFITIDSIKNTVNKIIKEKEVEEQTISSLQKKNILDNIVKVTNRTSDVYIYYTSDNFDSDNLETDINEYVSTDKEMLLATMLSLSVIVIKELDLDKVYNNSKYMISTLENNYKDNKVELLELLDTYINMLTNDNTKEQSNGFN